jgi:hypothetical protein
VGNKIRWCDQEFPLVSLDSGGTGSTIRSVSATFGEISYAERLLKKPIDAWSSNDQMRVAIWLSIRRVDHTLMPWDTLEHAGRDDFTVIYAEHPFVDSGDGAACEECPHRRENAVHVGDPTPAP